MEVADDCSRLRRGKCAGVDGLQNAGIYVWLAQVAIQLSGLFDLSLSHCYLPLAFMECTIASLAKYRVLLPREQLC